MSTLKMDKLRPAGAFTNVVMYLLPLKLIVPVKTLHVGQ